MLRFTANLTWLYQEHALLDRIGAAANDGFRAVEMNNPYEKPAVEIAARLEDLSVEAVLINSPAGDNAKGDRGLASLPGREEEFRQSIDKALKYSEVLGNRLVHVVAGVIKPEEDWMHHRATFVSNLVWAAERARSVGVTLLVEPINPVDIPGYFLNRQDEAHAIVHDVGAPNLKVQMDLYHCQVVEGNVEEKIRKYLPGVAHMQVAGVPGRNEPDSGELNYAYLFTLLEELGYSGWIGAEYRPRAGTSAGLGWARQWLQEEKTE